MGSKGTKKRKVADDNHDDENNAQREIPVVAKETTVSEEDVDSDAQKTTKTSGDQDEDKDSTAVGTTAKKKRLRKRKRKATAADEGNDNDNDNDDDEPSNHKDNIATPTAIVANDHEKSAQVNRTLYIEGIPFAAKPDQVRHCILEHATFLDATNDIVELRLPTWQDSGRLRGYGHVVFSSQEHCTKVLSLFGSNNSGGGDDDSQKMHLQNRYLTLQPAQAPKTTTTVVSLQSSPYSEQKTSTTSSTNSSTSEPSTTILLHNLAYAATEEDIEAAVSDYGAIVSPGGVRVVRHSGTGVSKGFGYVSFVQLSSAMALVASCSSTQGKPLCILNRPCRVDYDHGRIRGSFRTADRKLYHQQYKSQESSSGSGKS
jgi:nucleolin